MDELILFNLYSTLSRKGIEAGIAFVERPRGGEMIMELDSTNVQPSNLVENYQYLGIEQNYFHKKGKLATQHLDRHVTQIWVAVMLPQGHPIRSGQLVC